MKIFSLARLLLPTFAVPPSPAGADSAGLDSDVKKAAYAIGFRFGMNLLDDFPELDSALVQRGLVDAMKNAEPALALELLQEAIMTWQSARQEAASAQNAEAAKAFLAANSKKPGVVTLPSGLQYEVLASGTGASPGRSDRVTVHYHGTLLNGQVFDSSVQRGEPAEFQVGQVIPGWVEALQRMKAGDKWTLFIPPELAYGDHGTGPIGPGSALIFEVELLEVQPTGAGGGW